MAAGEERGVVQEEDRLPVKTLAIVIAVFVVLAASSGLWTVLDERSVARSREAGAPAERPRLVEQRLFAPVEDPPHRGAHRSSAAGDPLHDLDAYAWADRAHGRVAIPIDDAMRVLARRGFE